jgi:hypothetical protein
MRRQGKDAVSRQGSKEIAPISHQGKAAFNFELAVISLGWQGID